MAHCVEIESGSRCAMEDLVHPALQVESLDYTIAALTAKGLKII